MLRSAKASLARRLLLQMFCAGTLVAHPTAAQNRNEQPSTSQAWSPDLGNGWYKNPVLFADYSDPDVIRVGRDFYLVSSSFNMVPGLPILHSRDLVNWQIIGHALTTQQPQAKFSQPQHGDGVWAPAIRFHAGVFYIFYPDPDVGIYMIHARKITGPWSTPVLVKAAPGWIDPCPFWNDDGRAYLVNAAAASRGGVKGVIMISRMSADGTHLLDDASIVVDGHEHDPTLEGPKIYKRQGWYYLFAPAGGVPKGWEVVYRSRNIYGPYERRVVLAQGSTDINGPHQGAWVETAEGQDWFMHFQDRGPYGRVVLLEPMRWKDDWPQIGTHISPAGVGEPVTTFRKPSVRNPGPPINPADSDEFNRSTIGPQWQWQADPQPSWAFPSQALGALRIIAVHRPADDVNLWNVPNVLSQKLPGPEFTATTKLTFTSHFAGEQAGIVLLGASYAYIGLENTGHGLAVHAVTRLHADRNSPATDSEHIPIAQPTVYLRVTVHRDATADFSFSENGRAFHPLLQDFHAVQGRWIGATIGIFALGVPETGEAGYADFDWFRISR